MTSTSPQSEAQCNEFIPLLSRKAGSAPLLIRNFTACTLLLPAAIISAVLPVAFAESISVVWPTSSSMTSTSPQSEAQSNEFHPLLSRKAGSAPLLIRHFTACTLLLPAAVISVVLPVVFAESISVVWPTSSSMTSTSPQSEAQSNEFHPLLSRKAGSAPLLIRHFTACTLLLPAAVISVVLPVVFAESISVVWPTSSSMTSTSPQSEAQCNEFIPLLSRKAGSAPLLIRHFTACTLLWWAAVINAVLPVAFAESISVVWLTSSSMTSTWPHCEAQSNEFIPLLSRKAGSAPLLIRHFTACTLLWWAAVINAVLPVAFAESISVVWLTSSSMTSTWPQSEAQSSEFHPLLSRKAGSAPLLIRHFTACTLLWWAAVINAVLPVAFAESISVVWLTSSSMTSTWPYCEAQCNEFIPLLSRKAGSAPLLIRHFTTCTLPVTAASVSSVKPCESRVSTWIPRESRDSISATSHICWRKSRSTLSFVSWFK